ncbi:MAG TPA: NUDIX domain-containing protein [Bryobacteraceae bacterium]|nr:NUDIX domain-containing protein [Bryobacteraceae bacterium]
MNADLAQLESALPDPRLGLPEDVFLFVSRITPLINVDLLIQDDAGRTLLTWRDDEFFGAGWHVPGGIIRHGELAADRVRACAVEELGAEVSFEPAPIFVSETIREERTRGHFVSLLYRCRLLGPPAERLRAKAAQAGVGQWCWHSGRPADLLAVQSQYARFF